MQHLLLVFFKPLTYNIKKKQYTNKFINNKYNRFPFERVEDVGLLLGSGQNHPLPLLLPQHVQIEDDLLNGGPCPVVRLAPHKLIVSVDAVVGVELLATTLAGKHIATVLPNCVLARHLQRLKALPHTLQG